ncbi:MAG TPA: hypothetical protein VMS73_02780 [Anaerolineaceae bacterium]|nr:hypothetical protein [Anaerolineaceae bacterium]
MNKNTVKSILHFVVIPFLAVLTACSSPANAANYQVKPLTQPAVTVTSAAGSPSVTVKDQEYDGTTVIVADAFSVGPGWMVIHNQENGVLGPPIGYTQINAGDNKNIAVKIDPAQATAVMYAMMHVDAGVIGKYEFPGPDVPAMDNGEMVAPAFKATVHSSEAAITPSITVVDQDVSSGKVLIASVTSRGPGWIDVHTQGADGKMGSQIGYTAVKSGINQNIVINIDPTKATPVMEAMLHIDAGVIGKYEAPGPDAPQQANGQMVAQTFRTSPAAAAVNTPTPVATGNPAAGGPSTAPAISPTPDMGMVMTTPSGNVTPLVKVSDQPLAGDAVTVDEVVSAGPGWIVIYTTNANGQPDQPIGHAAVKDGENFNVVVPVDPTKAKGTLYAQLQVDAGTVGVFESPGADAPVMVGVQMIASTFKISANAAGGPASPVILQPSITVSDQVLESATVTAAQVVSNGNWWLVIHRQNPDGAMGAIIGSALLKNGVNKDVVVKIDLSKATPFLYAALNEDHGVIGQLEYPGPDVPVMVNGILINQKFALIGLVQDVTIDIQKVSNTVSYLTDGNGMSLYISLKDVQGKSNCSAACLATWRPVLVNGKIIPGAGVNVARLGVITLPDGTHQVTYLGAPLYTYSKDVNPGDTNGHGVDGVWFLVVP